MTWVDIDIQNAHEIALPCDEVELKHWASLPLQALNMDAELSLCLMTKAEIQALNERYRSIPKPTNVLAFPVQLPPGVPWPVRLLGDVIICPAVLQEEALYQNIPLINHWAHIIIHGVLHLLGYDHENDPEAEIMQKRETELLNQLNIPNPYSNDL